MEILHAFADTGVESSVLKEYGNVTRLGIDPMEPAYGESEGVVRADGLRMPFRDGEFDVCFAHPPCLPWTTFNNINKKEYVDVIPQAREEVKRVSVDYVIENKPESTIRNDIVLEGSMFGIRYEKKRAFECSFYPGDPPDCGDVVYFSEWKDDKTTVMNRKGYVDKWIGHEAKNSSIPVPYVRLLMDRWERQH